MLFSTDYNIDIPNTILFSAEYLFTVYWPRGFDGLLLIRKMLSKTEVYSTFSCKIIVEGVGVISFAFSNPNICQSAICMRVILAIMNTLLHNMIYCLIVFIDKKVSKNRCLFLYQKHVFAKGRIRL